MKWNVTVIALFVWVASSAQIEVIQYSAEFVKDNEISLNSFRSYDTNTLYMSKASKLFAQNKVEYIPTIILFNNGEEVFRLESGISLKLPENTIQLIQEQIEEIIESKF
tara:strand:+ start:4610 stop:4936 length:327 start_codon:yes stop_codon:yes gene_type:complete